MAYILNTTETAQNSGTSITAALGTHAANDLLLVCVSNDGGGTTISTSTTGWTNIGTFAASGGSAQRWAYKVAGSSSETAPVFTVANSTCLATAIVIRDADASTPLGSLVSGTDFVRSDWNNVYSSASGSLTTATDGCLLLYSWNSDGADIYQRCKSDELIAISKVQQNSAQNHIIGYRQQNTAGAAPTVTMYCATNTEGGNGWVLAIRNKSGGIREKDCRTGVDEFAWYGSFNASSPAPTWAAPNGIAATINSITCSSTTPTVSNTSTQALTPWGKNTALTSTENTAGAWVGGSHTITSKDMSGKVFALQWEIDGSSATARVGAEGAIVVFGDGTNWVAYQLLPKTALAANTPYSAQIALGNATAYASSGSITWAAVTQIGYYWHRVGSTASASTMSIRNASLLAGTTVTAQGDGISTLTGGGSSRPVSFTTLVDALGSWGAYRLAELQGSAQVLAKASVRIGDGSSVTVFDSAASSLEYPVAKNSTTQLHWNALASSMGITIKASASDTINLAAGVMSASVNQLFTIDAASSGAATYSFSGESIVGFIPTDNVGLSWSGTIFKSCGKVTIAGGGDATNCTISATVATDAAMAITANGSVLTGDTIDVTGTSAAYHLELGAAVTSVTLADVTFTGTPATDKVHVLKTSGTVTITISGSTSLSAGDVTSAGATVVIDAPAIYQEVQITNLTTGSRVQIYDTTNNLELANEVSTGSTVTWTDSVAYVADRDIRVRIAYVSGATAKTFIEAAIGTVGDGTPNAATLTYRANQVADAVYDGNAIDGSAVTGVTFTDGVTDKMLISLPSGNISLKAMYAAWVYYAFTEAGIATDIDYISANDIANYAYSNMVWKNTDGSGTPLKVIDGYAWDADTLDPMDLIDTTGGTIFLAPPHVVAKTVAVGGSPMTEADRDLIIAAIPSSADTATAVWSKTLPL